MRQLIQILIIVSTLLLFGNPMVAQQLPTVCAGQSFNTGPDGRTFCNALFVGSGQCSGLDTLPIYYTAWETRSISIRGVKIHFWPYGNVLSGYAYAGNSYTPDIMASIDLSRESTNQNPWFPDGLSYQLPSSSAPGGHHVDLHINCTPSVGYAVWMLVYYTINPS
jgi:hypothetical protein